MTVDTQDSDLAGNARWSKGAKANCPACVKFEAGAPAVVLPLGHTLPTSTQADIETAIHCSKCGAKIYKRRVDGVFACSGQGHEFTIVELQSYVQESFKSLTDLGSK